MIPYYSDKKNHTLGKHSVTKFKVKNAMVNCTDVNAGNFVKEDLLILQIFFNSILMVSAYLGERLATGFRIDENDCQKERNGKLSAVHQHLGQIFY